MLPSAKMQKMNRSGRYDPRRAVCRRCGTVMSDIEDCTTYGEFFHGVRFEKGTGKQKRCVNDWKTFDLKDTKEVAEFVRKRVRRAAKRAGTSV